MGACSGGQPLCVERKALWRDSDTVPEAVVKDNNSIRKYIYYVVNVFSNSGYIAYCGIGLFPHCG